MTFRLTLAHATIFSLIAAGALAQDAGKSPAPAAQPRIYNAAFDFGDNTPYTGTMSLTIAKGAVTGTMKVDSPTVVTGDVEGTLKDDGLTLDYAYRMESQSCGGKLHIEAKMTAAQDEASGTAKTDGGCSPDGQPVSGTFTLKAVAAGTDKQ